MVSVWEGSWLVSLMGEHMVLLLAWRISELAVAYSEMLVNVWVEVWVEVLDPTWVYELVKALVLVYSECHLPYA